MYMSIIEKNRHCKIVGTSGAEKNNTENNIIISGNFTSKGKPMGATLSPISK